MALSPWGGGQSGRRRDPAELRRRDYLRQWADELSTGKLPSDEELAVFPPNVRPLVLDAGRIAGEAWRRGEQEEARRIAREIMDDVASRLPANWTPPEPPDPAELARDIARIF